MQHGIAGPRELDSYGTEIARRKSRNGVSASNCLTFVKALQRNIDRRTGVADSRVPYGVARGFVQVGRKVHARSLALEKISASAFSWIPPPTILEDERSGLRHLRTGTVRSESLHLANRRFR